MSKEAMMIQNIRVCDGKYRNEITKDDFAIGFCDGFMMGMG